MTQYNWHIVKYHVTFIYDHKSRSLSPTRVEHIDVLRPCSPVWSLNHETGLRWIRVMSWASHGGWKKSQGLWIRDDFGWYRTAGCHEKWTQRLEDSATRTTLIAWKAANQWKILTSQDYSDVAWCDWLGKKWGFVSPAVFLRTSDSCCVWGKCCLVFCWNPKRPLASLVSSGFGI